MLGNHNELCLDWKSFNLGTAAVTDPRGSARSDTSGGIGRIARGGSVWNAACHVRCSRRQTAAPDTDNSSTLPTLSYRLFLTIE